MFLLIFLHVKLFFNAFNLGNIARCSHIFETILGVEKQFLGVKKLRFVEIFIFPLLSTMALLLWTICPCVFTKSDLG